MKIKSYHLITLFLPSIAGQCSVCGVGLSVTKPDVSFTYPGQSEISCGLLEEAGQAGLIPLNDCISIPDIIKDICDCKEVVESGCSICGDGKKVSKPNEIFMASSGDTNVSCGALEMAGKTGVIPLNECRFLPDLLEDICGCILETQAISPTRQLEFIPIPSNDDEPGVDDDEPGLDDDEPGLDDDKSSDNPSSSSDSSDDPSSSSDSSDDPSSSSDPSNDPSSSSDSSDDPSSSSDSSDDPSSSSDSSDDPSSSSDSSDDPSSSSDSSDDPSSSSDSSDDPFSSSDSSDDPSSSSSDSSDDPSSSSSSSSNDDDPSSFSDFSDDPSSSDFGNDNIFIISNTMMSSPTKSPSKNNNFDEFPGNHLNCEDGNNNLYPVGVCVKDGMIVCAIGSENCIQGTPYIPSSPLKSMQYICLPLCDDNEDRNTFVSETKKYTKAPVEISSTSSPAGTALIYFIVMLSVVALYN